MAQLAVLCCRACQREQFTVPCHFLPYGERAISIFFQFIQFLGATNDGEVGVVFISPFHLFADSAKHPVGQLRSPPVACRSRSPFQLACPFTTTRLPMRPSRVGWDHRKTKYENVLSCFISFTDEQTFQQVAEEHDASAIFAYDDLLSSHRCVLRHENLTNLKIYDIIYLQGEGRKMNHLHHHLHYA